ncbi:MAG: hypothetical protein LBJ12_05600 [Oscillospiraceae bacterium]|jgi:hypothetical protein|nr:hypothetical protein [Oscillospiraceae bacterium]
MPEVDEKPTEQELTEQLFSLRKKMKLNLFDKAEEIEKSREYHAELRKVLSEEKTNEIEQQYDKMIGLDWPYERNACVEYLSEKLKARSVFLKSCAYWIHGAIAFFMC